MSKLKLMALSLILRRRLARWHELNLYQKAGRIKNLKCQVKFDIKINDVKLCYYVADFTYERLRLSTDKKTWDIGSTHVFVVEDVKSPITRKNPVYRLKKKLLEALYGLKIREV